MLLDLARTKLADILSEASAAIDLEELAGLGSELVADFGSESLADFAPERVSRFRWKARLDCSGTSGNFGPEYASGPTSGVPSTQVSRSQAAQSQRKAKPVSFWSGILVANSGLATV